MNHMKQSVRIAAIMLRNKILLKKGYTSDFGVCATLLNYLDTVCEQSLQDILNPVFLSWTHFSGDCDFPVPVTSEAFTTVASQYAFGDKYEGKQLELRLSLLQHIINELKQHLLTVEK